MGCAKPMGYSASQADPQLQGPATVAVPSELRRLNPDLHSAGVELEDSSTEKQNSELSELQEYDEQTAISVGAKSGKYPKRTETGYLSRYENYGFVWIQLFPNLSPLKTTVAKYPRAKSFSKVSFSSSQDILVMGHGDSKAIGQARDLSFDLSANTILLDQKSVAFQDVILIGNSNGSIRFCWNGNKCYSYRGVFKVMQKQQPNVNGGKPYLSVINIVDFEQYVKGVVRNEIGSDVAAATAIEAQSIAARTYGLYSKINAREGQFYNQNGYELFPTEQHQLYLGVSGESEVTNDAVDKTKSLVMLYKDQVIRAEFHASAGGKTKADKSVPYLKAVDDPGTAGKRKFGHGRGLSQLGAIYFSKVKKWSSQKILNYYYQDIEIKKLRTTDLN